MTKKIKQFVSQVKLVIPLALCFVASMALNFAYQAEGSSNRDVILRQKQYMVDMVALEAKSTALKEEGQGHCSDVVSSILTTGVEHIDTQPHTMGILLDTQLNLVSERRLEQGVPSDKQIFLNPTKDTNFVKTVRQDEQGVYKYSYGEGRVMKVYFKWVHPKCTDRVLLATGITDDLVQTRAGNMAIINTIIILVAMSGYVFIILWGPRSWNF